MTLNTLPPEFTRPENRPARSPAMMQWPVLPPDSGIEKALGGLRDDFQRLNGEVRTIRQEVDAAPRARAAAQKQDREAYAAALLTKRPDPGNPATVAFEANMAALRRRADALITARAQVQREAEYVLAAQAAALQEEVDALIEEHRLAAVEALAAMEGSVQGLQAAKALKEWLLRPTRGIGVPTPYLPIKNTANEHYAATAVLDAIGQWLTGEAAR